MTERIIELLYRNLQEVFGEGPPPWCSRNNGDRAKPLPILLHNAVTFCSLQCNPGGGDQCVERVPGRLQSRVSRHFRTAHCSSIPPEHPEAGERGGPFKKP